MSSRIYSECFFFFFQAEDGIRDATVTGVQTCALPVSLTSSFLTGAAALLRVARARRAAAASAVSSFLPIVEKKLGRFLVGEASSAAAGTVAAGADVVSCVDVPDSWSVESPVTSTGRLRPLRLLRLLLAGLPCAGGVPVFCSWFITDLHWIRGNLQRATVRHQMTARARFQDTCYSTFAALKRRQARTLTKGPAMASRDKLASVVTTVVVEGDSWEPELRGFERWLPVRRARYRRHVREHCRR